MVDVLHIRLLGEFSLVYGDQPVTTINTARLQALLAYFDELSDSFTGDLIGSTKLE